MLERNCKNKAHIFTMKVYPEKNAAFQGSSLLPPRQIYQTVFCSRVGQPVKNCEM